jgi:hypothetical protein
MPCLASLPKERNNNRKDKNELLLIIMCVERSQDNMSPWSEAQAIDHLQQADSDRAETDEELQHRCSKVQP